MSEKHYNTEYLEETGNFLRDLKVLSYSFFKSITEGVIIDLGCGIGEDIYQMSEILGNNIKFYGIDHDINMLNKGTIKFKKDNLSFLKSEAHSLPFSDNSVAGIRTERMTQHLQNPHETFEEMYRITQKNGIITVIETDWDSLNIYDDQYNVFRKIRKYLTEKKINNGMAAKSLIKHLQHLNLDQITFQIFPFILNSLRDANEYLWLEKIISEAFESKFITKNEFNTAINHLNNLDNSNCFRCSINLVMASGKK